MKVWRATTFPWWEVVAMRKLLSANISRLLKSKVFWGLEAASTMFSAIAYVLVGVNVNNIGENWILEKANLYFFIILLYVCVLTAIFSCLFFGTEYSDGTLRNKLVVGHSRKAAYFSNWIINAGVTVIFMMTHYLMAVIIGIPAGGMAVITAVERPLRRIVCSLILVFACTAIFTMTTMLDSNKARGAIVNTLLALALMIVGFMIFSALETPEFKCQMVLQQDGSYLMEDGIPNPRYVSGGLRTIYTVLEAVMPTAFAMRIVTDTFFWYHVMGSLLVTVLFSVVGVYLFKKKDIR